MTLNEAVMAAVGYPGTYNENLYVWAEGQPGETVNGAVMRYLGENGGTGTYNERWMSALLAAGVPAGTLNEMMLAFFAAGGSFSSMLFLDGDTQINFPWRINLDEVNADIELDLYVTLLNRNPGTEAYFISQQGQAGLAVWMTSNGSEIRCKLRGALAPYVINMLTPWESMHLNVRVQNDGAGIPTLFEVSINDTVYPITGDSASAGYGAGRGSAATAGSFLALFGSTTTVAKNLAVNTRNFTITDHKAGTVSMYPLNDGQDGAVTPVVVADDNALKANGAITSAGGNVFGPASSWENYDGLLSDIGGIQLFFSGDSWMAGNLQYITMKQNYTIDQALSGRRLLGVAGIAADMVAFFAGATPTVRPVANNIAFDGSGNDLLLDAATITVQQLKDGLVQAINAALTDTNQVVYVTTAGLNGGPPGSAWKVAVGTQPALNQMRADFDAWAIALCEAIGVKYINIEATMCEPTGDINLTGVLKSEYHSGGDPTHPDAVGRNFIASMIDDKFAAPAIVPTLSMQRIRLRPNLSLMTTQDLQRMTAYINIIEPEWDKILPGADVWLLGQADVTVSGNARTGIKYGRTFSVWNIITTTTRSPGVVTSSAEGMDFGSNVVAEFTFLGTAVPRTAAIGMVRRPKGAVVLGNRYIYGCATNIISNFLSFKSHESDATPFLRWGFGTNEVTGPDFNVYTNAGKYWEQRSAPSGGNNLVTLYSDGVAVNPGGQSIASTAFPAELFMLNGINMGPISGWTTSTGVRSYNLFCLTDGTKDATLWKQAADVLQP